jgi:hypothetical protein
MNRLTCPYYEDPPDSGLFHLNLFVVGKAKKDDIIPCFECQEDCKIKQEKRTNE